MKPEPSDPGSNWIAVGFLQPGGQELGLSGLKLWREVGLWVQGPL